MRDSSLKRFLVSAYFSARELKTALVAATAAPRFPEAVHDYDSYWTHRSAGGVQPRFQIIERAMQRGDTVLDIGCGDGAMLEYLTAMRSIDGLGIDISTTAVERARTRGVDARVGTLQTLRARAAPGQFDHVVMSEVLEHVPDSEAFLRDAWTLTRRTLWVTFPNIAYLPHRLRLLFGHFPVQWVVFPGEHLRFWALPDFRAWLASQGLPASEWHPSNGITVLGAHRLWPNLMANQIVVRCDR